MEEFGEQSTELGRPVFLSGHGWKFDIFKEEKKYLGCGGCVVKDDLLPRSSKRCRACQKAGVMERTILLIYLVVYPAAVRSEAGKCSGCRGGHCQCDCRYQSMLPGEPCTHTTEGCSYGGGFLHTNGALNTDLSRLEGTNDGYIDNVHTLRDQYGADLVSLLTTTSDYGGMANTMIHPSLGFESSGFNVNVWDIIGAPNYTLAHEIGHNLGCLHNREDATWTSEYDYGDFSFGKRWMVGNEGYRTVMSYDSSNFAYNNRIPHFSNPNISYEGVTTGNAGTEDNAKVLTLSAPYTANFRSSVVQGIVTSISSVSIQEESTVSFKVRLAAEPAGTVSLSTVISGDENFVLSGPTTLTFDSSNWNIFQTVVISALPDTNTANGTATVTISSSGVNSSQVQVTEIDSGNNTASGYMLGGVVQNELGMGMPGVTMTFSDGSGPLTTDANGSFYIELSNGWSGTITPSRDGYTFSASSININSLSDHSVGHAIVGVRSAVLYVDIDATGAGDGSTWANAYTDLSDAFFARVFTEVWVAEGTYLPGEIRSSFFLLPPNIPVYGGFNSTETSRDQRDPDANPTILSGDIGTSNDNTDNTYHVVVPSSGSVL